MWSVAQIKPNQVHIAIPNLTRQGYNTLHPTFAVRKAVRNEVVTVDQPAFPGYLFVELQDGQLWAPINSTYGVARLMTRSSAHSYYQEPSPIPDHFIAGLKRCCCENDERAWRLATGTTVRILKGPFASREAIVSWSDADRCRLIVYLLSGDIQVEMFVADVIALTEGGYERINKHAG